MTYQLRFVALIWIVVPLGILLGAFFAVKGVQSSASRLSCGQLHCIVA